MYNLSPKPNYSAFFIYPCNIKAETVYFQPFMHVGVKFLHIQRQHIKQFSDMRGLALVFNNVININISG